MRKPESTKKTSTPTKPAAAPGIPTWHRTTSRMAIPRRPSRSGRKAALAEVLAGALAGVSAGAATAAFSGAATGASAGIPVLTRRSLPSTALARSRRGRGRSVLGRVDARVVTAAVLALRAFGFAAAVGLGVGLPAANSCFRRFPPDLPKGHPADRASFRAPGSPLVSGGRRRCGRGGRFPALGPLIGSLVLVPDPRQRQTVSYPTTF